MALLISTSAFAAITKDSSWDQILRAHGYYPQFPNFGLAMQVTNFCADGEMLRGLRLKEVCVERSHNEAGECIRTELVNVDSPRTKTRTYCIEWEMNERGDCLAYRTETYRIPLTFNVEVMKDNDFHREGDRQLAFVKEYTIPACK